MNIWDWLFKLFVGIKHVFVVWIAFLVFVVFMTYTILRIHVTYQLQRDVALLQSRQNINIANVETHRKDITTRLEFLEQTLYGEVQPKQEQIIQEKGTAVRPSRIEIFQQNTNKELRARQERIENRQLSIQQRLDRLERLIEKVKE